jgi:hypothetical protein
MFIKTYIHISFSKPFNHIKSKHFYTREIYSFLEKQIFEKMEVLKK